MNAPCALIAVFCVCLFPAVLVSETPLSRSAPGAACTSNEERLFAVAYDLVRSGSIADGVGAFESAVKHYPLSPALLLGAGAAVLLQGNDLEAVPYLLQAADLNPTDLRLYPLLSSASHLSSSERVEVIERMKRYHEFAPKDGHATYFYALSLLSASGPKSPEDSAKIQSLLEQTIQLEPKFAKAYYQLGILYSERGDYLRAAQEYEAAIRLAPEMSEAHFRLATAYARTKNANLAAREMKAFHNTHEPSATGMGGGMQEMNVHQFISLFDGPDAPTERKCVAASR